MITVRMTIREFTDRIVSIADKAEREAAKCDELMKKEMGDRYDLYAFEAKESHGKAAYLRWLIEHVRTIPTDSNGECVEATLRDLVDLEFGDSFME